MSAAPLPTLRRNLVLFAFAFAAASMAFGTVMLTSPPISEAAVSTLTDDGIISPVTVCEYLPTGDIAECKVRH